MLLPQKVASQARGTVNIVTNFKNLLVRIFGMSCTLYLGNGCERKRKTRGLNCAAVVGTPMSTQN